MEKHWKQCQTLFWGAPKSLQMVIAAMKLTCLLLGRKVTTNLDSTFKSRDITLPTKVCLVKAMVFPVVMYGCESWTVKKDEHRRFDAFKLRCWRRFLSKVPWGRGCFRGPKPFLEPCPPNTSPCSSPQPTCSALSRPWIHWYSMLVMGNRRQLLGNSKLW